VYCVHSFAKWNCPCFAEDADTEAAPALSEKVKATKPATSTRATNVMTSLNFIVVSFPVVVWSGILVLVTPLVAFITASSLEPPVLSMQELLAVLSCPSVMGVIVLMKLLAASPSAVRRPEVEDLGRSRNRRQEPWCGFPECMPSSVGHRLVLDESRSLSEVA
jgi:hypothetical protein